MEGLCSMKQSVRLFLSAGCSCFPKQSFSALWHNTNPVQSLQYFKIATILLNTPSLEEGGWGEVCNTILSTVHFWMTAYPCSWQVVCMYIAFSLIICFFCRKWTYGRNIGGHHHITRYWLRTWTRHVQAYQRGNRCKYETIVWLHCSL